MQCNSRTNVSYLGPLEADVLLRCDEVQFLRWPLDDAPRKQIQNKNSVHWSCGPINFGMEAPPTFSQGGMKIKRSSWLLKHPCLLQGGGVQHSSAGRINIGSSWWRVFRRWGVPYSLDLIPSLRSHLTSQHSPSSTSPSLTVLFEHQLALVWRSKGVLASTHDRMLLMSARAKELKGQLIGIQMVPWLKIKTF